MGAPAARIYCIKHQYMDISTRWKTSSGPAPVGLLRNPQKNYVNALLMSYCSPHQTRQHSQESERQL